MLIFFCSANCIIGGVMFCSVSEKVALEPLGVGTRLSIRSLKESKKWNITGNGSTRVTITPEYKGDEMQENSTILVMSAVYPLSDWQIESQKQTLHTKDVVKQQGGAKILLVPCTHTKIKCSVFNHLKPLTRRPNRMQIDTFENISRKQI